MNPFVFSERTLEELERVQGARGAGRGRVDRSGNRKMERALGAMLRAPHELVFAGTARLSDAISSRNATSHHARSARALQTIDRTAKRTPQVMVKITSRIHDAGSTVGAMTYIGRVGMSDREPIGIETSEGKHLVDAHDMLMLAREWQQWEQVDEARRKGATAIAMVFSMPPGTDPEKVRDAVRELAENDMANRRWVMALHTDQDHPHVHLLIAGRDNDGRRFNPNREFLQHCRERFAENLRARGIEADATPRKARGYPPKTDPTPVVKMRERGVVPDADKGRRDMIAPKSDAPDQLVRREKARSKTVANMTLVRGVYQRAIAELEAHGGQEEAQRAKALRAFVDAMPGALDARSEIVERLKSGNALSPEYEKDPQLERLKSRVERRDAEQRTEALDRLARATAKVRSASAELKNEGAPKRAGKDGGPAIDRIRAKAAELRKGPEASGPRDALATSRERLQAMQRKVDEAVKDRDRGKDRDRERGRDKDRDGPSR